VSAFLGQFVVWTLAGWIQRGQRSTIDYLAQENRVFREQLGRRRVRLTDDQRRRLAVRAKALGRAALGEVAGIVTPDTLLRWYRKLVARKYDGSQSRGVGRPRTASAVANLVVRPARASAARPARSTLDYCSDRTTEKREPTATVFVPFDARLLCGPAAHKATFQ
jgi:hypothetical protein